MPNSEFIVTQPEYLPLENGFHYILKCTKYRRVRKKSTNSVKEIFCLDNYSENNLCIFIMKLGDIDLIFKNV